MQDNILTGYRNIWESKPVLRAIYHRLYERVANVAVPGETLEVGGGSGNLKSYMEGVVSTDIVTSRWLDAVADAQALPFRDGCFSNIVGVDIVHHIESPLHFFEEAFRVLEPGGRIILIEPAITVMSSLFYRCFHPEPVDMSVDPFKQIQHDPDRKPFDANQAIPTLLFRDHYDLFVATFPQHRLIELDWMSLIAYPLSGGFRPWSLIPLRLVGLVLDMEQAMPHWMRKVMGFRMLIVLEKRA
jgi:SAM-dependent methyltransferase